MDRKRQSAVPTIRKICGVTNVGVIILSLEGRDIAENHSSSDSNIMQHMHRLTADDRCNGWSLLPTSIMNIHFIRALTGRWYIFCLLRAVILLKTTRAVTPISCSTCSDWQQMTDVMADRCSRRQSWIFTLFGRWLVGDIYFVVIWTVILGRGKRGAWICHRLVGVGGVIWLHL